MKNVYLYITCFNNTRCVYGLKSSFIKWFVVHHWLIAFYPGVTGNCYIPCCYAIFSKYTVILSPIVYTPGTQISTTNSLFNYCILDEKNKLKERHCNNCVTMKWNNWLGWKCIIWNTFSILSFHKMLVSISRLSFKTVCMCITQYPKPKQQAHIQ